MWSNISGTLAAQRKRKRMLWWRWSSAAVLLLAFGVSGVWVGSTFLGKTQLVVVPAESPATAAIEGSSNTPWVLHPNNSSYAGASVNSTVSNEAGFVSSETASEVPAQTAANAVANSTISDGSRSNATVANPILASVSDPVLASASQDSKKSSKTGTKEFDSVLAEKKTLRSVGSLAGILGGSSAATSFAANSAPTNSNDLNGGQVDPASPPSGNASPSATSGALAFAENGLALRNARVSSPSRSFLREDLDLPIERELSILEYEGSVFNKLESAAAKLMKKGAWKSAPRWSLGTFYAPGSTNACVQGFSTGPLDHYYQGSNANTFIVNVSENGTNATPHTVNGAGVDFQFRANRRIVVGTGLSTEYWDGRGEAITAVKVRRVTRDSTLVEAIIRDSLGNGGFGAVYQYFNDTSYSHNYDTTQIKYHAQWLEVPLTMQYILHDRKAKYYLGTGLSASLLWKLESQATHSTNEVSSEMYKRVYGGAEMQQLNVLLSAGVEYPLYKHLGFRFEPTVRYGVYTPDGSILKKSATALSARVGLNLHF